MTAGADPLEVNVLGPTLVKSGGEVLRVARPMERALLVRLALGRGVAVPDDRLAADLWGEAGLERATERLRVVAFRLRTALGERSELVVRTAGGYRLLASTPDVLGAEAAADRMHAALRAGQHEAVRAAAADALARWRGPSLADMRPTPFAAAEGDRLDAWRLELTVHRLQAELDLGAAGELTTDLAGLASEHPLHEPITCLLAIALYRSGRQADALERLTRLRRALAEELGVDPAPDTAALELRVLRQDPGLLAPRRPAAPTAPAALRTGPRLPAIPAPTTSFVGRDTELAGLVAALHTPGVVTLVGGPGSGKTRLALEAVRPLAAKGVPVAFVDLAPLRREDSVITAVADATGVDPRGGDPLLHVGAALQGGLLVLDNAEHLVDQVVGLVTTLRRATPNLGVLVTSQRPLLLAEEIQHRIGPLRFPDAMALLTARAAAGTLPAGAEAHVAAICAAVDGLPLGIELAAGLTRTLTVPQLAQRMTDRLRLLVGGGRDAGTRHTSLRAALDWSNELLSPVEQAVLRRIGAFAGGFDLDAAEHVVPDRIGGPEEAAGGGRVGVETGEIAPALAGLVDRSLVSVVDDVTTGVDPRRRFTLLETVRDYAQAQLHTHGETEAALGRHLAWCLQFVRAVEATDQFGSAESVAAVFAEWPNLLAALDRAAGTPRAGDGLRLALALHRPWVVRGWFGEARRHFAALADARGLDPHERGRALSNQGFHALMTGRLDEAGGLLTAAAAVAGNVDDASLILRVQYQLGFIDYERCRLTEAIATLAAGYELARKLGHEAHALAFAGALGTAHLYAGDIGAALDRYTAAVAVARARRDESGIARSLSDLSQALLETGRIDEALTLAEESDHHARRLDDRQVLPRNELIRSAAAVTAGELEQAEAHCRAALADGDSGVGMASVDLADVLVLRGRLDEARKLLDEVYAAVAERGTTWLAARPVSAALALAAGDVATAHVLVAETYADHGAAGFGWPRYAERLRVVAQAVGMAD